MGILIGWSNGLYHQRHTLRHFDIWSQDKCKVANLVRVLVKVVIHMWDLRLKWPVYKAIWVISIINVVKSYLYMTSISSDPEKELLVL